MTLALIELADGLVGVGLAFFCLLMVKDQITRGWVCIGYVVLQALWSLFMLAYNFWTLSGWLLLVNVVWLVVTIAAVKIAQLGWRIQRGLIRKRDRDRLRRVLGSHERID